MEFEPAMTEEQLEAVFAQNGVAGFPAELDIAERTEEHVQMVSLEKFIAFAKASGLSAVTYDVTYFPHADEAEVEYQLKQLARDLEISVEVIRDVCADEIAEYIKLDAERDASLPVHSIVECYTGGTAFAWYGMNPYPRLKRVVLSKLAAGGKKAEKAFVLRASKAQVDDMGDVLRGNWGRAKLSRGLGALRARTARKGAARVLAGTRCNLPTPGCAGLHEDGEVRASVRHGCRASLVSKGGVSRCGKHKIKRGSERIWVISMASSETAVAVQRDSEEHATLRRVAVSSFLGNFIEWFDYASYSYFATVIALVLMPPGDPTVALLETFGVFALSFLMRPVGAFFWGHMGDKKGRKWALATSILMMSAATFVIGLLPTFEAVGILAPILLLCLRMVQSFSASGEYAGAATFLAEYAPSNHRGLYCSLVPASTATGLLIGSALATFMFMTWGHDSSFVTGVGLAHPVPSGGAASDSSRTTFVPACHDSPVYQEMQEKLEAKGESDDKPIKLLLTKHLRPLLVSFGACMLNAVGFYAVLTYLPNYLQDTVGYDAGSSSLITTICLVAYIAFIFLSGRISDKVGRKKMLIIACVGFIVFTVPAFYLLNYAELRDHPDRGARHVPSAHHQRRHAVELPVRDVPHRGALLRVRAVL